VEERFPVRMGSWRDQPVGPHVQAMYQIAFAPEWFPTLVPFLMMNRMGLTILVHPQSGRPRDDHTINPLWMGQVLPVKTEVLPEAD
jgi:DOPA 4,5-dioxygenase